MARARLCVCVFAHVCVCVYPYKIDFCVMHVICLMPCGMVTFEDMFIIKIVIFIIMNIKSYMIFSSLFVDISCVIIICNKFNKRNVRQKVSLMYQPIIEGHIKFIKSKASSFKDATFFNPNACPCDGDVLMNLNV